MNSIKDFNTFRVDHKVDSLYEVSSLSQLKKCLAILDNPIILGGGSNVLFVNDSKRSAIIVDIKGIEILDEDHQSVVVAIGAGEVWHDVVVWAINNDYGGIENLSLIPGKCGAAPMQNIGAYGVELKDCVLSVDAVKVDTGEEVAFLNEECLFGYRESIFKMEGKGKFVITGIKLKLSKSPYHVINTSYGDIDKMLKYEGVKDPSIRDVSNAVIKIRKSKLPDPENIPNAGSFFKNPIIPHSQFQELLKLYPEMPSYPVTDDKCKVPAGWLIDQCGWKGIMLDMVGVHSKQALVLVNHGTKNGSDILILSELIEKSVFKKFGISLEREVNVI